MKKLRSRFGLRTLLLTALTAVLITSSVVFAAVSAAENVTLSDVTPTDAVIVTEHVSQKDTSELPELVDPVATMTTGKEIGDTIYFSMSAKGKATVTVTTGSGKKTTFTVVVVG